MSKHEEEKEEKEEPKGYRKGRLLEVECWKRLGKSF